MPKLIKPVMGRPIGEALNAIKREPLKKGSINEADRRRLNKEMEETNATVNYIIGVVNPDVCVQELQAEFVANEILTNDVGRDTDYDLMVLINSFHLDCEHCLNGQCNQRDPKKPMPAEVEIFPEGIFSLTAIKYLKRSGIFSLSQLLSMTSTELFKKVGIREHYLRILKELDSKNIIHQFKTRPHRG